MWARVNAGTCMLFPCICMCMHSKFWISIQCSIFLYLYLYVWKKKTKKRKINSLLRHQVHYRPQIVDKQRDGEKGGKEWKSERQENEYTRGNRKLVVKQPVFSCWGSAVNGPFSKVQLFLEGSRLNHITQIPFIVHMRPVEWPPAQCVCPCVWERERKIGRMREINTKESKMLWVKV